MGDMRAWVGRESNKKSDLHMIYDSRTERVRGNSNHVCGKITPLTRLRQTKKFEPPRAHTSNNARSSRCGRSRGQRSIENVLGKNW